MTRRLNTISLPSSVEPSQKPSKQLQNIAIANENMMAPMLKPPFL